MAADGSSRVQVRALRPDEHPASVAVLARGMRDNPLHVAAYGEDPARRLQGLERQFRDLLRVIGSQQVLGTFDGETLIAVAGSAPPGTCRWTLGQRLRFVPGVIAAGPRTTVRLVRWQAAWQAHDPAAPHAHLGPVAVVPDRQGQGVGGQLMTEYCRRLDAAGERSFLETDKPVNVRFYARYGYAVVGEAKVLGVPNWFLGRPARPVPEEAPD